MTRKKVWFLLKSNGLWEFYISNERRTEGESQEKRGRKLIKKNAKKKLAIDPIFICFFFVRECVCEFKPYKTTRDKFSQVIENEQKLAKKEANRGLRKRKINKLK